MQLERVNILLCNYHFTKNDILEATKLAKEKSETLW